MPIAKTEFKSERLIMATQLAVAALNPWKVLEHVGSEPDAPSLKVTHHTDHIMMRQVI